jgi:glycosyltransferase 2 family protein
MMDPQNHTDKRKKNRSLISTGIKLLVTSFILFYIFYKYVNLHDFLVAFGQVQPWLFLILLAFIVINKYLIAFQTGYYFNKAFDINLDTNYIFKAHQISSFYGLILPGDLAGGLITWYYFSEKSGKKVDSATVIIFLRLLNIITVIAFATIGLVFEKKLISLGLQVYIIILAILLLLMFIPFVSSKAASVLKKVLDAIINIVPVAGWRNKITGLNDKLWDSVITCTKASSAVVFNTFLMSVFSQLIMIFFTYLLMIMVGIHLPFQVSVWLIGAITIVQLLPVSFAGLGVRDISILFLLGKFYQVQPEKSMVLSTFFLVYGLIFILLGGFYSLKMKKT